MLRKSRNQKGLTLLEILLAIVLLAMVIMATATVYPGGYKLNATNRYTNQATDYARGIIEEINMRPFSGPTGISPTAIESLSLQTLNNGGSGWSYGVTESFLWPFHYWPNSATDWQTNCPVGCWTNVNNTNPDGANYKFFYLPVGETGVPNGISVQFLPASSPSNPTDTIMAKIEVTVAWHEFRHDRTPITKYVTLTSWRTNNKNDF